MIIRIIIEIEGAYKGGRSNAINGKTPRQRLHSSKSRETAERGVLMEPSSDGPRRPVIICQTARFE
jgi:hypothetical protein